LEQVFLRRQPAAKLVAPNHYRKATRNVINPVRSDAVNANHGNANPRRSRGCVVVFYNLEANVRDARSVDRALKFYWSMMTVTSKKLPAG